MGCIIDDAITKLAGADEALVEKLLGLKYATKQGVDVSKIPTFSKLPVNTGETKTMTYAGIGSRETPIEVQSKMSKVAKMLEDKGYTLRSGGADGADFAFEKGLGKISKNKEIYLANTDYRDKTTGQFYNSRSEAGFKNESTDLVYEDRFPNANRKYLGNSRKDTAAKLVEELHPNGKRLKEGIVKNLMARNAFQVFGKELNSPSDFLLVWTPINDKGEVVTEHNQRAYDKDKKAKLEDGVPTFDTGGTGQAISYASLKGIPVINMADPKWEEQLNEVLEANKDKPVRVSKQSVEPKEQPTNTINIYSGDKNGYESLSNFNAGPITLNGKEFKTLEHAFQYWKASVASVDGTKESNQKKVLEAKSGFDAQQAGRNIKIDPKKWTDTISTKALTTVITRYYNNNPEAMKLLQSTNGKTLTHIGKTGPMDPRFPDILTKIRDSVTTKDTAVNVDEVPEHITTAIARIMKEYNTDKTFIVPENVTALRPNQVFVFGANAEGIHGKGSALQARKFGTQNGDAINKLSKEGNTWGVVTKTEPNGPSVSKSELASSIEKLVAYAGEKYSDKEFLMTAIGTGLANFKTEDILDILGDVSMYDNIKFPAKWKDAYYQDLLDGVNVDDNGKPYHSNLNLFTDTNISDNLESEDTRSSVNTTADFNSKELLTEELYKKLSKLMTEDSTKLIAEKLLGLGKLPATEEDKLSDTEYDAYINKLTNIRKQLAGINLNNHSKITQRDLDKAFNKETKIENYELFPGVFTNEEQTSAIEHLTEFLQNSEKTSILLKGRGGTGKTSIIAKVLDINKSLYGKSSEVYFSAPTNKALKVLQVMSKKTNPNKAYTFKTVAQSLSYVLLGNKLVKKTNKFGDTVAPLMSHGDFGNPPAKILIVDEASMLNSDLQKELEKEATKHKIKIIYMGDNVQLDPVNDTEAKYQSNVFSSHIGNNRVVLNKRMRQREDSGILPITDEYAKAVESMVSDNGSLNQKDTYYKPNFRVEDSRDVEFVSRTTGTLKKFVQEVKNDPSNTRWIMFNNTIHEKGKAVADKVRRALFPESYKDLYVKTEQLYVESSLLDSEGMDILGTGDELTVMDISKEYDKAIYAKVWDPSSKVFSLVKFNMPVVDLKVKDNITGETIEVPGYSSNTKNKLDKLPKNVVSLVKSQILSSSPAYVLTTHKAQGSTYKTVFADIQNIFENGSGPDKFQSAYVATSRPSEKLFMVGNFIGTKVNKEASYFRTSDKPATFNGQVDTILDEMKECGV